MLVGRIKKKRCPNEHTGRQNRMQKRAELMFTGSVQTQNQLWSDSQCDCVFLHSHGYKLLQEQGYTVFSLSPHHMASL